MGEKSGDISQLRSALSAIDLSGLFNRVLPSLAQFLLERIDPNIDEMASNQQRIEKLADTFADWADDKTDLRFGLNRQMGRSSQRSGKQCSGFS